MTKITEVSIDTIKQDAGNANKGTKRGRALLDRSLKRLGAGRSIVIDKNDVAVGGNKTLKAAKEQGFKKVVVVETDGSTLVAVKRTDLDAGTKKGRELAIADNRVAELDLAWDPEVLGKTDANLKELFDTDELEDILKGEEGGGKRLEIETIEGQAPPAMLWILLGVPFDKFDLVQGPLAELEAHSEIAVQSARGDKQ